MHMHAPMAPASGSHGGKPLPGEVFGALVNLSGRRRFTSQRLVLYAVLASQQQDGAATIATEALALFRGAHKSLLTDGDGLPGVFCPELELAKSSRWWRAYCPTSAARLMKWWRQHWQQRGKSWAA